MAIEVLKHQLEFITSTKRHTGLVGGFRSGKSHAGVYKTIAKKLKLPGVDVAYYLPTYGLIKDIAYPKFSEALTNQGIPFTLNRTDKDIITPYGRIIMRSMDNPDLIIGYEVGYSLVDEADVLSSKKMNEVMIKILARNSVKTEGNNNATDFVSTPEGFKFLYHFFEQNKKEHERSPNKHLIRAKTKDNPFISEDYIASLEEQYTPELLRAYLNGEFVNFNSGTVYREFDRTKNVDNSKIITDSHVLYVGMDFNITNMAATISIKENSTRYVQDEITDAYDTADICKILKGRYPNNKVIVYPDASGNSRNTSGKSDHDILRKSGFKVISPKKNPSVRDRINAVNKQFSDEKTFINSDNCPVLVDSLEKQAYKDNGEPDKQSGYDHINDAFGYEIYNSEKSKIKKRISNVF